MGLFGNKEKFKQGLKEIGQQSVKTAGSAARATGRVIESGARYTGREIRKGSAEIANEYRAEQRVRSRIEREERLRAYKGYQRGYQTGQFQQVRTGGLMGRSYIIKRKPVISSLALGKHETEPLGYYNTTSKKKGKTTTKTIFLKPNKTTYFRSNRPTLLR